MSLFGTAAVTGGGSGGSGASIHGNGSPEGVVTSTGLDYVDDVSQLRYRNPVIGNNTGRQLYQSQPAA